MTSRAGQTGNPGGAEAAPVPGRVLLEGVVGSTAYGLATEQSDIDALGIYVAPTSAVLGLSAQSVTTASRVTTEPDRTLHEVGKYAGLALKANPTVLELLWLPSYTTTTPEGEDLIRIRDAFLSDAAVRGSYVGYAMGQARRLLNKYERARASGGDGEGGVPEEEADVAARTAKHGRHCLRLLRQAMHLVTKGELLIDVGGIREELFAAGRLAAADPVAFHALFERELATLDATPSVLPAHPDRAAVDRFLVSLRRAELAREDEG